MPRIPKALLGLVLSALVAACSAPSPPSPEAEPAASLRGVRRTEAAPSAEHVGRYAFVVGNSEYQHLPDLRNPRADAQAIADLLGDAGFAVSLHLDVSRQQLLNALDAFQQQLPPDSAALIYYAGHAVQIAGRNHLIPVDVQLRSEADVEAESLALDRLLGKLEERRTRLNLLLLDACRNNPFPSEYRGVRQGLARLHAPAGTLIAYATSPGTVALDGDGLHSPYAAALLHHLRTPALKFEDALKRVRTDLVLQTDLRQVPWESSSLYGEDFMLFPPQQPTDARPERAEGTKAGLRPAQPEREHVAESLARMQEAFAELMAQESTAVDPEPQAAQWQAFLERHSDDFPHTDTDDDLRRIATQHLNFWQARVTEAQNPERRKAWAEGTWTEPHADIEFVAVAGNAHFRMGDVLGDEDGEVTVRMVPRFWMSRTEVTKAQWQAVLQSDAGAIPPSTGLKHKLQQGWQTLQQTGRKVVRKGQELWKGAEVQSGVSRKAAEDFLERLNALHQNRYRFRLPREAEWEYACRGGGLPVRFGTGRDTISVTEAHFAPQAVGSRPAYVFGPTRAAEPRQPTRAGSFAPNPLSLHDLSGNLAEWVEADHDLRGGHFQSPGADLRCAARSQSGWFPKLETVGLRIVREY